MHNTYRFFLPLLALAMPAAAQHTEIIGRAGLGLAHFGGKSAVSNSFVNYQRYDGVETGYTNNPYGRHTGAGVAVGGRAQRVGRQPWLLALDLGYEWLQSSTDITSLSFVEFAPQRASATQSTRLADGTTRLQFQTLTAFLGVGYRFKLCAVELDVLGGPEFAYTHSLREKGSGTYNNGTAWVTEINRFSGDGGLSDARMRGEATAWYHRVGLNASYSHGFRNYQGGLLGGPAASPEVYARTWRLGLAYRLR